MAEETGKGLDLARKIEKLIVDANKEVINRVEKKLDETKYELRQEMSGLKQELRQGIGKLDKKIDAVHTSLKQEISTTAGILDYGIKELDKKLEEHVRMPHPV